MNLVHTLKAYDPEVDLQLEYELQIDDDGVVFALTDDHVTNDHGTYPALTPRSVKIELREDGGLNVLLYRTDADEPHHFILTNRGWLMFQRDSGVTQEMTP